MCRRAIGIVLGLVALIEQHGQLGLSPLAANNRVDEAVAVIDAMGSFYPIAIEVDGGHVKDTFTKSKVAHIATVGTIEKGPGVAKLLAWLVPQRLIAS